jgi:F-type H+-transporting ATPase subunit beta
MTAYYVYENWTVKKARIHLASCSYCNDGRGIHLGAGDRNGQWYGPFHTFQEAHEAANETGQPVSRCKVCRPN